MNAYELGDMRLALDHDLDILSQTPALVRMCPSGETMVPKAIVLIGGRLGGRSSGDGLPRDETGD